MGIISGAPDSVVVVGAIDEEAPGPLVADALDGLIEEDTLLLLNLLAPLLSRLALLRTLLLDAPKLGDGWGRELAGVAISVGVTSLLVMMATVVRVRPLCLTLGLVLVLKRLGLMTGVKVRLGLVNVSLDLDLPGAALPSAWLVSMLDDKTKSSSKSSKLAELAGAWVDCRLGVLSLDGC